jgi:hypothetical protein
VRFRLGGPQGLRVLAAGFPKSEVTACTTGRVDTVESYAPLRSEGLSYDRRTATYTYNWHTDPRWHNTCRTLTVRLVDGTTHQARFTFV